MVERRKRSGSVTVRREVAREEERLLKRQQGRWWGLNINAGGAWSGKAVNAIVFSVDANARGAKLYGMDLLVAFTAYSTGAAGGNFVPFGMLMCHVRKGQTIADFYPSSGYVATGDNWNVVARPREFMPGVLYPDTTANNMRAKYGSVVFPFRLGRGKSINILPGESLVISVASYGAVTGSRCEMQVTGRFRTLTKPS